MIKRTFPFLLGCLLGMLVVGFYFFAIIKLDSGQGDETKNVVVADFEGKQLRRGELEKSLSQKLQHVKARENEVLYYGAREWLDLQLLLKEAMSQGISVEALLKKEVENVTVVSDQQVIEDYQQNSSVYGVSFEEAKNLITKKLNEIEQLKVKSQYLQTLRSKYKHKIFLPEPIDLPFPALMPPPPLPIAVQPQVPSELPAAKEVAKPAEKQNEGMVKIIQFDDLEGKPSKGPADAPITLVEFSDFHCPFCQKVTPIIETLIQAYPGKIRRVWRHFPLPFHEGAQKTHEASECAQEQGKFWEFHDKIFESPDTLKNEAGLNQIAQSIGLDTVKFSECLASGKYTEKIKADITKANVVGVHGTPNVFLNGRLVAGAYPFDYFKSLVDHLLDPEHNPVPDFIKQQDLPAPPKPPEFKPATFDDLAGKPFRGPENASVTIVQFSDFHCPFCSRVEPTLNQLTTNFSEKIKIVWRHYPLPMHPGSMKAHEASECAADQGKFWEYHDKIFAAPEGSQDEAGLKALAVEVGLDPVVFNECLTSGKHTAKIKADIDKGNQVGVQGTPMFYVNGQPLSGAQPYERFEAMVKKALEPKA